MSDVTEFSSFIVEAKRLISLADAAEARSMRWLMAGEANEHMWRSAGYSCFADVIKSNTVLDVARYEKFKSAEKRLGHVVVDTIGVSGAIAASRIQDDGKLAQAVDHMTECAKQTGKPVPAQTAASIAHRYEPSTAKPRVIKNRDRLVELEEENAELRRELASSKKTIAEKDTEIAKLKKALAAAETKIAKDPAKARVRKAA